MSSIGFEGHHCQTDKRMYCSGRNIVAQYCIIATMCKGFPRTKLWACGIRLLHWWIRLWVFPAPAKECQYTFRRATGGSSDLISALLQGHPVATPFADFYVCWCPLDVFQNHYGYLSLITKLLPKSRRPLGDFPQTFQHWGAALLAHNGADWCAAGQSHKTANDQALVIASQDLLCSVILQLIS